jgi:hypothetical protein
MTPAMLARHAISREAKRTASSFRDPETPRKWQHKVLHASGQFCTPAGSRPTQDGPYAAFGEDYHQPLPQQVGDYCARIINLLSRARRNNLQKKIPQSLLR